MLDYKDIIIKHYALGMSGQAIAATLSEGSKSGVNRFLAAFKACEKLSYPLPEGITNYGIAAAVYGVDTTATGRDFSYEFPLIWIKVETMILMMLNNAYRLEMSGKNRRMMNPVNP